MAQTWVMNETLTYIPFGENINFTYNNNNYTSLWTSSSFNITLYTDKGIIYKHIYWYSDARTFVFETNPTGDLLTWLQANGTLQPEPVSNTIKFGTNTIDKLMLGSNEVDAIYLGSDKVYEKTTPSQYQYVQTGNVVGLINAPYTQSGSEVIIGG